MAERVIAQGSEDCDGPQDVLKSSPQSYKFVLTSRGRVGIICEKLGKFSACVGTNDVCVFQSVRNKLEVTYPRIPPSEAELFGGYTLDQEHDLVSHKDTAIKLRSGEAIVLASFMAHEDQFLSASMLHDMHPLLQSRSLSAIVTDISSIRSKLDLIGGTGRGIIINVYGKGYKYGNGNRNKKIYG